MKTFLPAVSVVAVALLMPIAAFAQADIEPARFIDGSIPQMPPLAASGGDVMLSVAVSASGTVGAVDVLRSTPPFTEAVVAAAKTAMSSPPRRRPP